MVQIIKLTDGQTVPFSPKILKGLYLVSYFQTEKTIYLQIHIKKSNLQLGLEFFFMFHILSMNIYIFFYTQH